MIPRWRADLVPNIVLKSPRVYLRPPMAKDWQEWRDIRDRNREYLVPFEPAWPEYCMTEAFFRRRLQKHMSDWLADRNYAFLIFLGQEDRLIGGININNVCRGAACFASPGYWLDRESQGQGLMAESLERVISFCFGDLALHRLNAGCLPHNEKSRKLLVRVGFEEEGFAKKYLEINGDWQDHILYGLTVESWSGQFSGGERAG